jgi:glycosyltransferase involved in cell wall biosynthesis
MHRNFLTGFQNNMIVSVIIPCYNVEGFISECLDSVISQTYKDIEVICVDDGSIDGTVSILKEYRSKYPELIQVLQQVNSGAPSARNKGLSVARGEYIQFLDADDLLLPEKIHHQIALIKQTKTEPDVVAGYCIWKRTDGSEITHHFTFDPWKDLVSHSLGDTCSNLWNHEALKKINGWNEQLRSSQEADLLLRLLKINASVLYDPVINTIVRQRGAGSVSSYNRKENLKSYLNVRIEALTHLKGNNMLSEDVNRAILKQLFLGVRELIHHDELLALSIFKKYIPPFFPFSKDSLAGITYKIVYFFWGFKRTELIIFKRLKAIKRINFEGNKI